MQNAIDLAKELKDTDCALVSYKINPLRYVIAKKYTKEWTIRQLKNDNPWLKKTTVLNGK